MVRKRTTLPPSARGTLTFQGRRRSQNRADQRRNALTFVPPGYYAGIDELTDEHWKVLRFLREDYPARKETATLRRVTAVGGFDMKELFRLFPGKPAKKMSYIAGLPKPKGCV